jgi:hypothetical protein
MSRPETIELITSRLPAASDATLLSIARQLDDDHVRALTAEEMDLIERSRADFAAGRTFSRQELEAHLARLRQPAAQPAE